MNSESCCTPLVTPSVKEDTEKAAHKVNVSDRAAGTLRFSIVVVTAKSSSRNCQLSFYHLAGQDLQELPAAEIIETHGVLTMPVSSRLISISPKILHG